MSTKLHDMYVKLMTDPDEWEKLRNDPESVVDSYGLSDREKNLVMNGPAAELKAEVEKGFGPDAPCLILGFVIW